MGNVNILHAMEWADTVAQGLKYGEIVIKLQFHDGRLDRVVKELSTSVKITDTPVRQQRNGG